MGAHGADPTKEQCINANENAQKLRDTGKLRAAKKQLLVCVAKSCPGPVREDCTERLASVEKALPSVVFNATGPRASELGKVRVTMDGETIAGSLDLLARSSVDVDPGRHAFELEASGLPTASRELVIMEGEKQRRVEVDFTGSAGADAAKPPPVKEKDTLGILAGGRLDLILPTGAGAKYLGAGAVIGADFGFKLARFVYAGANVALGDSGTDGRQVMDSRYGSTMFAAGLSAGIFTSNDKLGFWANLSGSARAFIVSHKDDSRRRFSTRGFDVGPAAGLIVPAGPIRIVPRVGYEFGDGATTGPEVGLKGENCKVIECGIAAPSVSYGILTVGALIFISADLL